MTLSTRFSANKYNHSILFLNNRNEKEKYLKYPGYKANFSCFIPQFKKANNLRKLLSNEEFNWISGLPNWIILIVCLIVIIIGVLFIKYLYRQWRLRNIDEEIKENNELSDKAQLEFETNFLNAKTFSFIPITSPIKLKDSLTPKSEDNSNEETKSDESEKEEPDNLKIINISSFCITCQEGKNVAKI